MAIPVAVLGSTSSHGGTVITASPDTTADGIEVARNGDLHACPITGHGVTPVAATAITTVDGLAVMRIGDVAGCGAVIVTGSPDVVAS